MTLKFRTNGPWGPGEGGDLPAFDIDMNFYELLSRIIVLEGDPPVAVSISDFTVVGTQLTVVMTDATTRGPFTLPTTKISNGGEWQPNTLYVTQTFLKNGGRLYLVVFNHVSNATFDPGANDGDGHDFYELVLDKPIQPYDIGLFYPPNLPGDASVLLQHVAARDLTMLAEFDGCQAFLQVACSTNNITLPIKLNGDLVGTIDFVVGENLVDGFGPGQFGTFNVVTSPGEPLFILVTDRLTIEAGSVDDPAASGLSVTLAFQTEAL